MVDSHRRTTPAAAQELLVGTVSRAVAASIAFVDCTWTAVGSKLAAAFSDQSSATAPQSTNRTRRPRVGYYMYSCFMERHEMNDLFLAITFKPNEIMIINGETRQALSHK
jgi:hypothetical protein